MKKYLLNIQSGTIHDGKNPCYQGAFMSECNRKWFDIYSDAENYFEGKQKKGLPCGRCLKHMEK